MMTVSELAGRVGTTADTVRYYERIGLLPEARRSDAGYRLYEEPDVERLRFIKRAQSFGLQLDDIGELVRIRDEGLCPCGHTREKLNAKLEEIEQQIIELEDLRSDIRELLDSGEVAGDGCWPCGSNLLTIEDRTRR